MCTGGAGKAQLLTPAAQGMGLGVSCFPVLRSCGVRQGADRGPGVFGGVDVSGHDVVRPRATKHASSWQRFASPPPCVYVYRVWACVVVTAEGGGGRVFAFLGRARCLRGVWAGV